MTLCKALLLITSTLATAPAAFAAGPSAPLRLANGATPSVAAQAPFATLTLIDAESDGEGGDDDEGDDDGDDDESGDDCSASQVGDKDDEAGCTTAPSKNPAKAGSISPPQNGLFTTGTAPVATTN